MTQSVAQYCKAHIQDASAFSTAVKSEGPHIPGNLREFKAYEYIARILTCEPEILQDTTIRPFILLRAGNDFVKQAASEYADHIRMLLEMNKREEQVPGIRNYGPPDPDDYSEVIANASVQPKFRAKVAQCLSAGLIQKMQAHQVSTRDPWFKKIKQLRKLFSLTAPEIEVFFYCLSVSATDILNRVVYQYLDLRSENGKDSCRISDIVLVSIATGIPEQEIQKVLHPRSTLRWMGILDSRGIPAQDIQEFFEGRRENLLECGFFRKFSGTALDLSKFKISERKNQILNGLLSLCREDSSVHILFHGVPGTGKTELARALAMHHGLNLIQVAVSPAMSPEMKLSQNTNENTLFRFRALEISQRMTLPQDSLYLLDECDTMLSQDKSYINQIMDHAKGRFIWIANKIEDTDPSTLRRFDYSMKFDAFDLEQRSWVWKNSAEKHGLHKMISPELLENLAHEYSVSAGGIDVALRNLPRLDKPTEIVRDLLDAHTTLVEKNRKPQRFDVAANEYSLEGLEVHGDLPLLLHSLQQYFATPSPRQNLTILLYGPPGTGKTELARYLARSVKRSLLLKRVSDIMGKYVGETEKAVDSAFREAEAKNAILFFDEADSFLQDRTHAMNSWEITHVNEMLSQIECFEGVVICATNFEGKLDQATRRRFHYKFEFDYLKPEGIEKFWNMFFAGVPCPAQASSLKMLTPGDFKAASMRLRFLSPERRNQEELLKALREELDAKDTKACRVMGL